MKYLARPLLTLVLATVASTVFAQGLDPVIVEAESGVLGSEYTTGVDGTTTYVYPTTTGGSTSPGTANRVITYSVTFPHSGVWELYARMYVENCNGSDDSFFYGNGFGTKDPANGDQWITANNLGNPSVVTVGYTLPGDKVVGGGPGTCGAWKWVKLSAWSDPEASPTFTLVEGALTQTFQIGRREDGLRFDKFAFGPQTFEGNQVYFTVYQLDNGLPGTTEPPPPPYVPPGPPIATCHTKFLGSIYSTSQIVNFDAYFNQITPENGGKWGSVEATRDVMSWTEMDAAYARAQTNGIPFRMHTLIWGNQQPAWIASLPPSEQFVEIVEWFSAVAARYPNIDFVEVVNEPLHDPPDDDPGETNDGNYIEALGGAGTTGWDWVINAFALARGFFPNAKLAINEYSVENDAVAMQNYIGIIQLLQAQGLIDIVGIQGHAFSTRVPAATITSNLNLLETATGLPIHITELDIDGPTDEVQLTDYQRIFPAFWEHPAVKGITLWGYRPGMWRTPQGAYIAHQNGAERPALVWLLGYVNPGLAIDPASDAMPAAGGSGSVAVVAPSEVGCTPIDWTAVSNDAWITITGGDSGTDAGTVSYSVEANLAGPRSGTITIAGQTFIVNQSAAACSYAIDPTSVSPPAEGASGTVAVTTDSWCSWTAASNDAWITVTGGASGTGDGTVSYSVAGNPGGARTGTVTIAGQTFTVSQAPLPSLSIDDVTVTEGDGAGVLATLTVTLSAPTTQTVTVNYATADNTAVAPGDYTPASGTLTLDPLVTSQTLSVTVNGDLLDEPDETFNVSLSSPVNALIGQGLGVGTIVDNDPAPSVSIGDVSVIEGNSGTTAAVFDVALSAPSSQTVTVGFETVDQTATAGFDYTAASGTLTFQPGQTTGTVSIDVLGDTDDEDNETFLVTLSDPTNAVIGDGEGIGTILDDENALLLPAALTLTPLNQGVLASGETVEVQPSWRNDGAGATADMTGSATASNGGTIVDGAASYGVVGIGATASCAGESDCYSVTASGPRPANHWDVKLNETLSEPASHEWLLHVGDSFSDVPRTSSYFRFIETLYHNSIAGGCTATSYCPNTSTTRAQMAIFALLSKEGSSYSPQACGTTPVFTDVPVTSPYCKWVEEMARRGIVGGCGGGNYCPTGSVTRAQMAIFVLRTLDPTLDPPACGVPVFADVPATSPYCKWVEELARRGVVSGCGGGNYCPNSAVTRAQIAVFLSSTFGLTLYGP
jgi:endo-1,4-beta-xylanase